MVSSIVHKCFGAEKFWGQGSHLASSPRCMGELPTRTQQVKIVPSSGMRRQLRLLFCQSLLPLDMWYWVEVICCCIKSCAQIISFTHSVASLNKG